MQPDDPHVERRSWWREPMLWLVIALPLGAVVASIWLIASAIRTHQTFDDVPDVVRRTAQVQQSDLGPDERAAQMRLKAILELTPDSVSLREVGTGMDHGAPMMVNFSHPFEKAQDRVVQLQASASGWRGKGEIPAGHDWNVRVQPINARWRIQGRLRAGTRRVELASSLAR